MSITLARDPDQTRALIIATSWDLFRQLGARTTVTDIADKLNMSSANVYRYFPTKKALTDATCEYALGTVYDAIRAAALAQATPALAVEAALRAMHVMMRDQMTCEARAHEIVEVAIAERWPAIDAHHVRCADLISEIVALGQRAGEFGPGDPAALAIGAMAACASIHHPSLITQCAGKPPWPGADEVIAFALRG